jgi:flagellar M-ring protein FliF
VRPLIEGLKALGPARLAAMGAVAVGVLGLLAMLTMHGGAARMALLYGDLDLRESGQIADQLGRQHIAYQVGGQGGEILVAAEDVSRARLLLAKEGLPSGGSIGYEIFDRGDGLTATQFQQTINETRALEGELARTIRGVVGVRGARVHLVLPRREPFARESQPAQASVMLTMAGPGRLDREAVQAIVTLVAAAVPGLRPQAVAVVDSRGTMLARAGEPTEGANASAGAEEMRRATELRLSRAVEEMLERSLGAGRVRAEAAVEMDFERFNETKDSYDPDGQVVRSTQTVNSNSKTTEAAASVSVQNNLPNADAGSSPTGSQDGKQEETTNYEIGHTVRTLIREQPQIKRISLAVMVDGVEDVVDGKQVWKPRPPEELERIASLVRSAVGYDEKRGDRVEVQSMRLAPPDDPGASEPHGLFGLGLDKSDLMPLAQTGLTGLIVVVALLAVLRPMVARLTVAPAAQALDAALSEPLSPAGLLAGPGGAQGALSGPGAMALLEDESMVSVSRVEGQLRASSIRKVAELAERNPEQALGIMRGWLHEEPA